MGEYVPTTEEVREYVSIGGEYRPWDAPDGATEDARAEAFDRWLADHDAELLAVTVEKLADAIDEHRYSLIIIGECVCGVATDNMPAHQARAALTAALGVES